MVTIKDIAKKAGVSVATVSRAINNKNDISETMRNKIMKIIEKLNYVPNSMAKNLSHGSSNLIAVMLPAIDTPFFSELLTEIENEANLNGYNIMFFNSSDNVEKLKFYINSMISHFVKGAIINSSCVTETDLSLLEKNGIKTISIDRTPSHQHFAAISVDHFWGAKQATEHLFDMGCNNPIMISGPTNDKIALQRQKGFKEAFKNKKGKKKANILSSSLTIPSGYQSLCEFLKEKEEFDGVFCVNDATAFGAIRACQDNNIRVPNDVLIVGYDNSLMSDYYFPRLTTVDQRTKEVGKIAISMLIDLFNQKEIDLNLTITPKLVVRESTKT